MNEKRKAPGADGAAQTRACVRAEELVTYLYGESTPEEARAFRQHLDACAVCREELAAFGRVREGVGLWRAEGLGAISSLDIRQALAPFNAQSPPAVRKRSAAAALREFFSLSPLWLRAGALATALAVCALAALTLARAEIRWDSNGLVFRAGAAQRVVVEQVKVPVQAGYTQEQLNAAVAERLDKAKAQWEAERQRPEAVTASADAPRRTAPRAADGTKATRARRPPQRAPERDEELADLPRLSDLLNGNY